MLICFVFHVSLNFPLIRRAGRPPEGLKMALKMALAELRA